MKTEEELNVILMDASQYFNMKSMCAYANIPYSTYQNWKNRGKNLSYHKKLALIEAMKEISRKLD